MINIAGDVEIYPNFFSFVFRTVETNTRKDFVIFDELLRDDREQLIKFLKKEPIVIGYNSLVFDVPILQALMNGYSVYELWSMAQEIISYKGVGLPDSVYHMIKDAPRIFTIDLKQILNLDIGLKQCAIMMQWPKLQELPFDPMKSVTIDQAKTLIEYNDNDSQITRELFLKSIPAIELRAEISQRYKVNVTNASDSKIANLLINAMYERATGLKPAKFTKQRTYRKKVKVKDCIGKNIEFVSDEMKRFYKHLQTVVLEFDNKESEEKIHQGMLIEAPSTKLKNKFNETVTLNNVVYQLGVGGLHSKDEAGYFESTDTEFLIDADVASFYPRIILNNKIKPKHVHPIFIDKLEQLTEERLKEKAAGNSINAWALKIVINSIFGKMGAPTFWLYDPLAFYSVTISGQLYLLSLIDKLNQADIETISANTDGIICKVKSSQLQLYDSICQEWQEFTGFDLEFSKYKKYVRRDVNSYLAVTEKGEVKTKGAFDDITQNPDFSRIAGRKYNMPVVTKALRTHYIHGDTPEKFIKNQKSIFDFLVAQKPGKKFKVGYGNETDIQHTNRFYISKRGQVLYKYEPDNPARKLSITVEPVTLLNDVNDFAVDNYSDLDYDYYVQEVKKIMNKIKPPITKNKLF